MSRTNRSSLKRVIQTFVIVTFLATVACNAQGCSLPGVPGGPTPRPTVDISKLPPVTPQLVEQHPLPGEELPLDGSIDLYFDQPMNQTSVTSALTIDPPIQVETSWIDDSSLRITPSAGQLQRASSYTITIEKTAASASGLALIDPLTLEVQTVGYLIVSEVVPARNADGVEPNSVITVLFNRPVVPLGIAEDAPNLPQPLTFQPDIPGTGEWINTSIYQWKPSQALAGGQSYTVNVSSGLTDQTGGVLQEPFSWSFTTLPPGIVAVTPADGEQNYGLDDPLTVEFNQPMDQASVQSTFALEETRSKQAVSGSISWDETGSIMTFTPSGGRFALDGQYQVTVGAGAHGASSAAATLGSPYSWSFSTVLTPAVVATDPVNGAANVDVGRGLSIHFSAPMDQKTLTKNVISSDPALPEDTTLYYSDYDFRLHVNAYLQPATTYTVTVGASAADPYGHTIGQPYTFSFTTGNLSPLVRFNTTGQYGLYNASQPTQLFVIHRNVSQIQFSLASISLEEFGRLSRSYEALNAFRPSSDQLVNAWTVAAGGPPNEPEYIRVPVEASGGALPPGLYLLSADAPEIEGTLRHFMIVTTANLTLKVSFDESMAWLTDLQSGQPVANAPVTFYDDGFSKVGEATTDSSGVASAQTAHRDNLWDTQYAVVNAGGTFALALSDWSDGIQPYDFSQPAEYSFQNYSIYMYSDRPLYRPGQEVFFKGVMRSKNDVTYGLPQQPNIHVEITNDQGESIYAQDLPLSSYGTFSGSLQLSENAGLGYYNVLASIGSRETGFTGGVGFQVAEYRKPEFTVEATAAADAVLTGDTITVSVDSQFFFGGPVSNAEVSWTALADTAYFAYDGPGNYQFNDYLDDTGRPPENWVPGFGEKIADGVGKTDANGKFTITLPARLDKGGNSQSVTIEATVTDINERSVSGRAEVIVHKGQYYPGVSPDAYVGVAGQQQTASLIVVDWDSNPVPNQQMSVQVFERRWNSVQETDEQGRTQYVWNAEDTPVGNAQTVTTDKDGKASIAFTPPKAGTYKILATVVDPKGNTVKGSGFMWVTGVQFVAWRQANNSRIDLIADKKTYEPGDTSEILIASPFQGNDVKALITVERGSILSHEVVTLTSNSYVYKLPITGSLAPDVYVSVVIVKGVDETNPLPAFRMGMVRLNVDPVEQTVNVEVKPDKDVVGPGDTVNYTVTTTDFQGKPVDTEVSLALVDLAALSLSPANSGKIVDHFFGSTGLSVRTAVPLLFLVDRLNQELIDKGKGGGGGGGEGFFDVRENFKDTAYWTAQVQTGAAGSAKVTIQLPDNLTTWRMDARAISKDTLVGQAEIDIVATRPLLIRPDTPRFFVVNDQATVSAVVNNNTEKDISAEVSLEGTGVALNGDAKQKVSIPSHGRVVVGWPLVVNSDAEWVDLTFSVQGGGLSDASKPTLGDPNHGQMLPVYNYAVPETVGTAGQLTDGSTRIEGIALPRTYQISDARVDVQIDPSLAATMIDGLDYLKVYPYDCTEQTVSKFLPNALTLIAFRKFNLSDDTLEANLQTNVSRGLQKLYAQQHTDGGWGWFVNSKSDPKVSAYVIQGMAAAREAGVQVDGGVMDQGISYLQAQLFELSTMNAQYALHRQAYILYVLAKAGQPDVSRTVQMYDNREGMQHWARALVAQTLWMIDPQDSRLENIKSDLVNAAILSATGAHWEEESNDYWNWNTDTRSTAMILDTFALLWADNDLAPNATRWLMVARRGGHWETTQETVWALIGLTDWMVATGELDANYDWTFMVNNQEYGSGHAGPDTLRQSTKIRLTFQDLLTSTVNRLSFGRSSGTGRMYYTAHLTAYLPVEKVKSLSRGVIVSRRYLDAADKPVTEARTGDVLTVQISIIAPNDLYYVVVEDPYPAGAEAVNVNLLTESVLGERPRLRPDDPLSNGWGWWWFSQTDLRDEKAVLFADYLPAGTYEYTYQIRLGTVGTFRVIPPTAYEFYMPEVYGRGEGALFSVLSK